MASEQNAEYGRVWCCRLVPLRIANGSGQTHTNCPEPVAWFHPNFNPDYPLAYCAKHAPRRDDGSPDDWCIA